MRTRALGIYAVWAVMVLVGARPCLAGASIPQVTADAALVMETRSAEVLFEKGGYQPRHPASLTKILTGIVALEMGNPQDTVSVSRRAAYVQGSSMHLEPGQEYRFEDLIAGLLIKSANDGAVAIAEHISGSVEGFANLMNERAKAIGALHTHFKNPHGLTRPGHLTTAYDIALITRYALNNPEFARLVATKERDIGRLDGDVQVRLRNTNRLLWSYLGADGVKTGTTSMAGECLVASASRGDMHLIVVVMHSDRRWEDAVDLLEWGFEAFEIVQPLNAGQVVGWLNVRWGMEASVPVVLEEDLVAVVPKGQAPNLKVTTQLLPDTRAPVKEGEPLGQAILARNGERVASSLLVAAETVALKTPFRLFLEGFLPVIRGFMDRGLF